MRSNEIDLNVLENFLRQFAEGLHPKNLLERDGAIQRFELTFELSWKTLGRVLQADRPLEDNSVKGILREGGRLGLIADDHRWFEFQRARNLTSHTYNPQIANQVFELARQFPPLVEDLISRLQVRLNV